MLGPEAAKREGKRTKVRSEVHHVRVLVAANRRMAVKKHWHIPRLTCRRAGNGRSAGEQGLPDQEP